MDGAGGCIQQLVIQMENCLFIHTPLPLWEPAGRGVSEAFAFRMDAAPAGSIHLSGRVRVRTSPSIHSALSLSIPACYAGRL
jgi:hypothetical protein